jgi:Terminase RNaseH-like domain
VTNAYRESRSTPIIPAVAIKDWGDWIPCAWPHDGLQHEKGSGEALAAQDRMQSLNMLADRATFEEGGSGVEAGVIGMLDRMQTGRLKVFSNLSDWFAEKRHFHRKDGKIVRERDDLLSAIRDAVMMLRYAES